MEMGGTRDKTHKCSGWLGLARQSLGSPQEPPRAVRVGYRAVWCGSTRPHRATECLSPVICFHSMPEIPFGVSPTCTSCHGQAEMTNSVLVRCRSGVLPCKAATVSALPWSSEPSDSATSLHWGNLSPRISPTGGEKTHSASEFRGVEKPKGDTAASAAEPRMQQWMRGEQGCSVPSRAGSSQRSRASPRKTAAGCPQGCRGCWAGDIDWCLAFLMSCPTTCFNLAPNEGEQQQFLPPQPAPPALMS